MGTMGRQFGVRPDTIQVWVAEGMPRKKVPGEKRRYIYDLGEIVQWRRQMDLAQAEQGDPERKEWQPRATEPPDPIMGDIYVDSADGKLYIYDGTTWQACW